MKVWMLIAGSFLLCLVTSAVANGPTSYQEARAEAEREGKPLMVLVTAKWCPACTQMKKDTLEPLQRSGELEEVVFTSVDWDAETEVAKQLMQGRNLPQLVVMANDGGTWRRVSVSGMQSQSRVRDLVRRAKTLAPIRIGG
jgi:thiol:disulfide interchange protein